MSCRLAGLAGWCRYSSAIQLASWMTTYPSWGNQMPMQIFCSQSLCAKPDFLCIICQQCWKKIRYHHQYVLHRLFLGWWWRFKLHSFQARPGRLTKAWPWIIRTKDSSLWPGPRCRQTAMTAGILSLQICWQELVAKGIRQQQLGLWWICPLQEELPQGLVI